MAVHEREGNGPETPRTVHVVYDLVYLDDNNRESEVPREDVRAVGYARNRDSVPPQQESPKKKREGHELSETKMGEDGTGTFDGQVSGKRPLETRGGGAPLNVKITK